MRFVLSSRLTLAVALVATVAAAFAATVAPAVAPTDPRLAAFLAAGGTFADICGEHGSAPGDRHCEACRLLVPAMVPEPVGAPARWRVVVVAAQPAAAVAPRAASPLGVRSRAPPVRG